MLAGTQSWKEPQSDNASTGRRAGRRAIGEDHVVGEVVRKNSRGPGGGHRSRGASGRGHRTVLSESARLADRACCEAVGPFKSSIARPAAGGGVPDPLPACGQVRGLVNATRGANVPSRARSRPVGDDSYVARMAL